MHINHIYIQNVEAGILKLQAADSPNPQKDWQQSNMTKVTVTRDGNMLTATGCKRLENVYLWC